MTTIACDRIFDGERFHLGAATLHLAGGRIVAIDSGHAAEADLHCGTVSPGLVEAHCHLFLDGAPTLAAERQGHLEAGLPRWLDTGLANLERLAAHGVTLLRDAGDRHGVNHRLRSRTAERGLPRVRSCGVALNRPGRYGAFMSEGVPDLPALDAALAARADADDLKIVLTGIIDFAKASVIGTPQFDAAALARIVAAARARGQGTLAHCSGADGLELALAAGVDSIEHGFFMSDEQLNRLVAQGTCWCPTLTPVAAVAAAPERFGLDAAARAGLDGILDAHRRQLRRAATSGARILAGSDAGSPGVIHGPSLLAELDALAALGGTAWALRAATATPRRAWGLPALLEPGAPADLALWHGDPREGIAAAAPMALAAAQVGCCR